MAKAMLSVPSVTMNGGSRMEVISAPFKKPKAAATSKPHRMARYGLRPSSTANLVMTMELSAISMPQDRSMPAVRMMSVCPMASTPTTMTCCRISEKFWPERNRSLCVAKKAHAASSAMNGPSVDSGGRCSMTACHPLPPLAIA